MSPNRRGHRRTLAGALLLAIGAAPAPPAAAVTTPVATTPSWTVYHGDPAGSGDAPSVTAVDTSAPAWTSPALDGLLYGEPLSWNGSVFVATEADTVYALSASTGHVTWSEDVGQPVPSSSLPCGDITPTVGITGTPVVDPSRDELFVVAAVLRNGVQAHELIGLDAATGSVESTVDVDPPGADPRALLQRTALSLDDGRVVFGMGGNYGDCASYRGRVGSVAEAGGSPTWFTVDAAAGDSQGAVWMGGAAPAVDAAGDVWVGAGNGSVYSGDQPYDDSDSALELSPSLQLLQYFAPSDWPADNREDLDMSTAPALLADGDVLIAGKSRILYLLDGTSLGGIGGEAASLASGCGDDIDGGDAVTGSTVIVPCLTGPIAVSVTTAPPALQVLWRARVGGGPPIVAAGLVWSMGQDGVLYGLDPSTGAVRQQATVGTPANHFPTPGIGDGLLLVTSAEHVVAFTATASATGPTSTITSTTTAPTSTGAAAPPVHTSSGRQGPTTAELALVLAGVALALAATAWALRRRRHRRAGP